MHAVKLALLRLTRNQRLHSHRGVVLVDAKVVGRHLQCFDADVAQCSEGRVFIKDNTYTYIERYMKYG